MTHKICIYLMSALFAMFITACGSTSGERALSGAGIGAAVGAGAAAVTDGDVGTGAAVGAAVGGATGAVTDENQIDLDDDDPDY